MLIYNLTRNQLIPAQGEGLYSPPVFYYKEQKTMELTIQSGTGNPVDLSSAVSWRAAIVLKNGSSSSTLCRSLNAQIDSSNSQTGVLSVCFDTYTSGFQAAITALPRNLADCEIRGTDSQGNTLYCFAFRVFACAAVDPEGGNPPSAPTAFTQIPSDWNQTDTEEPDYIKNKPTIPAAVEYATQAEVNAGTVSNKAVSPLTLNNWESGAVYGVLYDPSVATASQACQKVMYVNGIVVPVSSFTSLPAHDFRRCVMSSLANRTIAYYLDPDDSTKKYNGTYNGITSDGSASDLTGTDGDVMVEIPITYWKVETQSDGKILYLVSKQAFSGATIHPFFYVGPGGATARTQYVGAYRSALCNASGVRLDTDESASEPSTFADGYKARSVAGAKPWTIMTRATHRTAAGNNGGKTINSLFKQYLTLMMVIEGGTFDTQAAISYGFAYTSEWNYEFTRLSGRCNYGNGTGNLLADATQDAAITWKGTEAARKIVQFQYRGIENPYAEMWEFEDGFVKVDSGYYWTADDTKYSDSNYTTDYILKEHTWPSSPSNGWVSAWDKESFLVTEASGSSTTGFTDYFFYGSGGIATIYRGGIMSYTSRECGINYINVGGGLLNKAISLAARISC